MVTSLWSLMTLEVVDMTASGAVTEDKVGVMTTFFIPVLDVFKVKKNTITTKYVIAKTIMKLNSMKAYWSHPWDEL